MKVPVSTRVSWLPCKNLCNRIGEGGHNKKTEGPPISKLSCTKFHVQGVKSSQGTKGIFVNNGQLIPRQISIGMKRVTRQKLVVKSRVARFEQWHCDKRDNTFGKIKAHVQCLQPLQTSKQLFGNCGQVIPAQVSLESREDRGGPKDYGTA